MTTRRSILRSAGALAAAGALAHRPAARAIAQRESTESLWNRTIAPFLADDQWTDDYAYDAGHILMVPLHAAFAGTADPAWREAFLDHAERFAKRPISETRKEDRLRQLHYAYVCTQMAVLVAQSGTLDRFPAGLLTMLRDLHRRLWAELPAWQWDHDDFPGGIRERLIWKRELDAPERSYYRAVIDEEFFCFALGADLVAIAALAGEDAGVAAHEAVELADWFFREEGEPRADGGWIFQPGVTTDHPDYAYAGNPTIVDGMEKKPVPGISSDTSHAHRYARWLRSLRQVGGDESRVTFYDDVLHRLHTQFVSHALVPPSPEFPWYRTTNFLDGGNGVYRWEYATQGQDNGYGPYELSGTLFFGWWTFLDAEDVKAAYQEMAHSFPLAREAVDVYVGPNTTRDRHPLATLPSFFQNGMAEVIVRLAAELRIRT
jgi:hypothetical protein